MYCSEDAEAPSTEALIRAMLDAHGSMDEVMAKLDDLRTEFVLEIAKAPDQPGRGPIPIEDALTDMAEFAGLVRSELAGLPARLTRIVAERQKVETEIDGVLSRLAQRAAEKAEGLEAGRSHSPARAEAAA